MTALIKTTHLKHMGIPSHDSTTLEKHEKHEKDSIFIYTNKKKKVLE